MVLLPRILRLEIILILELRSPKNLRYVNTYQNFNTYAFLVNDVQDFSKWLSGFKKIFIHNTLEIGVDVFFYLIEQHIIGALYVHPLWFYEHQHDNRVHSKLFDLNEVIQLCISSIYLFYYKIPSTQHKSQSYCYMFRLNKSSSGVSKSHN